MSWACCGWPSRWARPWPCWPRPPGGWPGGQDGTHATQRTGRSPCSPRCPRLTGPPPARGPRRTHGERASRSPPPAPLRLGPRMYRRTPGHPEDGARKTHGRRGPGGRAPPHRRLAPGCRATRVRPRRLPRTPGLLRGQGSGPAPGRRPYRGRRGSPGPLLRRGSPPTPGPRHPGRPAGPLLPPTPGRREDPSRRSLARAAGSPTVRVAVRPSRRPASAHYRPGAGGNDRGRTGGKHRRRRAVPMLPTGSTGTGLGPAALPVPRSAERGKPVTPPAGCRPSFR